jgi:hypothetical protein
VVAKASAIKRDAAGSPVPLFTQSIADENGVTLVTADLGGAVVDAFELEIEKR